jgi:hypothetical protein
MRQALLTLMAEVAAKDELLARHAREATFKQALIDKRTHEVANLRRLKYAITSEKFCADMSADQKSLIEETLTPTLPGTETSGVVDGSQRSPHSLRFDMARRC